MDPVQPDKDGQPAPILVVDDDRATRDLMALTLTTAGHEVVQAVSGHQALDLLSFGSFSAVVLDNHMPGFTGLDVLRALRSRPETQTLPVLLVTGDDATHDRVAGLRTGASDYIIKPFDPDELLARIEAQLRTQTVWTDVVEAHRRERQAIAAALANSDSDASVEDSAWLICSELERLGYPGVAILAATGTDTVVPIGVAGMSEWQLPLGRRLPVRLGAYLLQRAEHGPWIEYMDDDDTASGYAGGPVPDREVLAFAPMHVGTDLIGLFVVEAMARNGRVPPAVLSRTLSEAIDFAAIASGLLGPALSRRGRTEHSRVLVQNVIDARAFTPVFQPIVRVDDGTIVGYEALTRFDDGTAPDQRFVEATGLGLGIDLELATLCAAIEAQAALPEDRFVSLNISPAMAVDGTLAEAIATCDRPLVLELTEHDPVEDYALLRNALGRLTPHVHVSIDDAGAGFASLRHVLELRPEFMKLDRSWITGLDQDPTRQALVVGLGHFARATGCRLIAEGVETDEELAVLREFDVELGQGFLFGRPKAP